MAAVNFWISVAVVNQNRNDDVYMCSGGDHNLLQLRSSFTMCEKIATETVDYAIGASNTCTFGKKYACIPLNGRM